MRFRTLEVLEGARLGVDSRLDNRQASKLNIIDSSSKSIIEVEGASKGGVRGIRGRRSSFPPNLIVP